MMLLISTLNFGYFILSDYQWLSHFDYKQYYNSMIKFVVWVAMPWNPIDINKLIAILSVNNSALY